MAALDDVESRVNQCADTILKASNMAYDTVRHFGNMQQVVATGKAGALALADTLAAAPVGDVVTFRSNIGAQEDGKCVVNEEHIHTMGLSGGDITKPYVRKKDGNVCWLQPVVSMMSIGLGGEAWQVRQRFGLGNDESGRSAIGLGSGDGATFKNVSAKGVETSYVDLHKLDGDSADYQVRMICDGDGHAKIIGKVTMESLTLEAGAWAVGSTVMAACYTNANISFGGRVNGTDLMPCSVSGWKQTGIRLSGVWIAVCECGGRYDLVNGPASIGLWRRES